MRAQILRQRFVLPSPAVPVSTTAHGGLVLAWNRDRISSSKGCVKANGRTPARWADRWMCSSYMLSLRGMGPYCRRNRIHFAPWPSTISPYPLSAGLLFRLCIRHSLSITHDRLNTPLSHPQHLPHLRYAPAACFLGFLWL